MQLVIEPRQEPTGQIQISPETVRADQICQSLPVLPNQMTAVK